MFLYNILEHDKFNNSRYIVSIYLVIEKYRGVPRGGGLGYDSFDNFVGYIVELVNYTIYILLRQKI